MDGNWYPSFQVAEIYFKNEKIASKYHTDISKIITNFDLFNDKNYDYIVQNNNKLIYVSCGASIFSTYAFGYKKKIKQIIEVNKD